VAVIVVLIGKGHDKLLARKIGWVLHYAGYDELWVAPPR
jgi:hypothetical protein